MEFFIIIAIVGLLILGGISGGIRVAVESAGSGWNRGCGK